MGLILAVPFLIYYFTGLNIYNKSSISDSVYSMSLFEIRKNCATVLLFLLIYFVLFNKNILKQSILNKPIMGATCIIIKGGFEGLGDPELDEHHVTQKPKHLTFIEQTKQSVTHSIEISAGPYPPEASNAKHSKETSTNSGYPFWPRPTPAVNSDPPPTNEDNNININTNNNNNNNKKVRINEYTEVKQISAGGLVENNDDLINVGPKKKPQRQRADERDKNINDNSYVSDPFNLNAHSKENKKFKFRSSYSIISDFKRIGE